MGESVDAGTVTESLESVTETTETTGIGSEVPSRRIGPYRLLQRVGIGGMGEVWLAEQDKPIRRRVALKLIRGGMDTREVVARFRSERQALAMMDHPSIAKVFDAGTMEDGRPFFVMEYVQGDPITIHCNRARASTRDRIELMIDVCSAVQHAHQKAIIHRDLKPSNILIAVQDHGAVPKVIDFGVAKAIGQKLTDHTLYTQLGQMVGTLDYMSPEQAELTGQNVDTRTDVYSLGVVLYQLLVGALPFDSKEMRDADRTELQRKIREDDPLMPSARLSSLGADSDAVAQLHATEASVLIRRLKGDLDWITLKALDKDRTRRYGSPAELAADLSRHLRNEPVLAAAPSTAYRLHKFVRRHRAGVATAAALGLALLAGIAGTIGGLVRATRAEANAVAARDEALAERDRAEQAREEVEQVVQLLVGLFEVSDPSESRGETITARELLDRGAQRIDAELEDRPLTKARMLQTMGSVYQSLGLYEVAERQKGEALAVRRRELGGDHAEVASSLDSLASLALARANHESAEQLSREALSIYRRLHGEEHPDIAGALSDVGVALSARGDRDSAEKLAREALEMARRLPEIDDERIEVYVRRLANELSNLGKNEEAEPLYLESLNLSRKVYGQEHPRVAMALDNLAILFDFSGDHGRAEPLYRESLAMLRRMYGAHHPEVAQTMGNLADFLIYAKGVSQHGGSQKDFEEAETLLEDALAMNRRFRPDHPYVADNLASLGQLRQREQSYREAERLCREALRIYRLKLPETAPKITYVKRQLGAAVLALGRPEEAEPLLLESYDALSVEDDDERELAAQNLIELYDALGEPEKAAEYRALLAATRAAADRASALTTR